jgi:hypothetical protein
MPNPPSPARPTASFRIWLWLLGLAAVAALLVVAWWRSPSKAKIDVAELVRLKDLANGHLENGEYAKADKLFSELIRKLPENPLGYRNQTIARLTAVTQQGNTGGPNAKQETSITPEQLVESLTALAKREPQSAATYVLAARGGILLDERGLKRPEELPTPLTALKKATELEPNNTAYWYELSDLAQTAMYARDEEAQHAARHAISKAYELAPRNLAVLRRQIVMLAQTKEEKLGEVLHAAEETLKPLLARVEQQAKGNLEVYRQKALAAVEAGDWPGAMSACRVLDNLLAPQEAQKSDLRRVSLFALEFMRQDFAPEFYAKYPLPVPAIPEAKVRFEARNMTLDVELDRLQDFTLADVDLDQRLDLVALTKEKLTVFAQRGEPSFPTWNLLAEINLPEEMEHVLVGDLDRDVPKFPAGENGKQLSSGLKHSIECEMAYPDFVLYGPSGILLIQNKAGSKAETRELTIIDQTMGLQDVQDVRSAILVDWDHDGDLDAVAAEGTRIRLWRHLGNLQFDDASAFSQLPTGDSEVTTFVAADVDHDLDIDIVCNGSTEDGEPFLLENLRHGQFRTLELDASFALLTKVRQFALVDLDGSGAWDVITPQGVVRTESPGPGVWKGREATTLPGKAWSRLLLADFDNDGTLDPLIFSGSPDHPSAPQFLRGLGGSFVAWDILPGFDDKPFAMIDYGDIDNDGDLDLVAAQDGKLMLLSNDGGNANAWLQVRIAGRADEKDRVNASGIGSTVEVKLSGRYQSQIVTRQPLHFGLGNAKEADACRILFTNGVPQVRIQPPANQQFCEKMELLSSCPFLYTWTGERFEFYTDLLWAAPLGLQVTAGNVMPDRPWEYLKIDGEKCLPKDGAYTLQITGELWEADYFDEVKLIAVDHPADVQIFTNEKVGPPAIAEHKIHTVHRPRKPVSAINQRGRDLMPELAARDGNYAKPWDRAIRQGLVEEHFIQLDLGKWDKPQRITLFLTGWIYPTDVGLNAALDQHPDLAFPNPPSISLPDSNGDWKVVRPFMGFPSGKTKTIAVDLSDLFGESQDYRLRIAMSQELYWDEIFFTVDEDPVEVRETPLELAAADLHYRGFSGDIEPEPNAPRIYDYAIVRTDAKWPPMRGKFTRYGDVKELLKTWDDQQVVLGAGDEMTVTFLPPKNDTPPGWKRDFVLYNVGWDKDAVLHTLYGQDSDPLPFKAMTRYPYGPEESFPDTPQLRSYLQRYQTREQRPELFWRALRRN